MFSFHKPKVYRSTFGCCICKAKSSSSRFTDSKKYESEFGSCFRLISRRCGEICNACVLLVKRWRKLPAGTNRDWHHVVDARAGPGTKSMIKYKSKSKMTKRLAKKNLNKRLKLETNLDGLSDDVTVGEDCHSDQSSSFGGPSMPPSLAPSPAPSDVSDDSLLSAPVFKTKTRPLKNRKTRGSTKISAILDMSFWKKEKVCCGTVFKGPNGQVLIDPRMLKPCRLCKPQQQSQSSKIDMELEADELVGSLPPLTGAGSQVLLPRSKCRLMMPSSSSSSITTTNCTTTVIVGSEELSSRRPNAGVDLLAESAVVSLAAH